MKARRKADCSPERILVALKSGARTACQLAEELGVALGTMRKALPRLEARRAIKAALAATGNKYGAPPRIYWRADEPMIQLGMAHEADVYLAATRVGELLLEHGEVAVFVDDHRNIGVALHHTGGYQDLLAKHSTWLVGRYRRIEDQQFRSVVIAEDMLDRLDEIHAAMTARAHS